MPPSITTPSIREKGQPGGEVGLVVVVVVEVTPNTHSSVLVNRKRDDVAGSLGCKKSKAPMSLRSCMDGPIMGCLMTAQDVPPAPPTFEVPALLL